MNQNTIIHLDKLWAAYRTEPILQDINWHWRQGQRWAIIGNNGAGKTALANIITDQLRPQRGSITYGSITQDSIENSESPLSPINQKGQPLIDPNRDILHLSFEMQRKLIEHDIRFDDSETRDDATDIGTTVKQIILQKKPEDERFSHIVKQCHIDHILDRGIRFVSTGESRKTLLARALYQQPKLLILDNPFEGLDKQAQSELQELINQLLLSSLDILLLIKQVEEIPSNIGHVLWLDQGKVRVSGERSKLLIQADALSSPIALADLPPARQRPYSIDYQKPLLELKGVNVSFNQQKILNDIHWRFNWGQHCCISGPNGAGKSTLLNLICGDNHKAYGQEVYIFGQRRGSGESLQDIKQKFGVVSTQLQLNHMGRTRVAEVIASGLYDSVGLYQQCTGQDRKLALDWLKIMGLENIASQFFNQLSFGQQRLAMLTRAMVKSPLILILDEPCIGLDQAHRNLILSLIDKIAQRGDCHILYVSHSENELPLCINQQLKLIPSITSGSTCHIENIKKAF